MKTLFLLLLITSATFADGVYRTRDIVYDDAKSHPETAVDVFKIEAPSKCEVGELVKIDAIGADVDSMVWEVIPETPDFAVVEENKLGFFSARAPGEYLIIIAGAKGGQAFLHYQTLTVEGPIAPPTGISPKVKDWLRLVPKDTADRSSKIKSMAGVFRKLANDKIEVDKILDATALANSAILGDDLNAWIPFLDKLGTELDAMIDAGALTTVNQYRQTWLDIAKGLDSGV